MLYYLASELTPHLSFLNVFSYHTVRSGGALITAFLLSLLLGPALIRALQRLKVGQFIKEEHVKDLHALHKGKAGTPTMGGVLIIVTTLLSLAFWSIATNPLLLVAIGVLCLMGAVGFLDDFIKLRRKHNDGLSARAKLVGQVLTGTLLGVFVVWNPITYGASYVAKRDVLDWHGMTVACAPGTDLRARDALRYIASSLPKEFRVQLVDQGPTPLMQDAFLKEINHLLEQPHFYNEAAWTGIHLNGEATALLAKGTESLSKREVVRLNRILVETAAPGLIAQSPRSLHTKVAVPGLKEVFISLGAFYIVFVVFIMVATSNAVNLTDGIDGLAAGAAIVSISAFTGIAYIVSRADWSSYLFITYIPEASELTVFGSALLGAGLGFLWFNSHPAEVFMGDTGSLALGGVMGAMAVLTKQELLLPIVGGLFVLEALSVIIQVTMFKLRGTRVFRMAPLHHHFELIGWSESKVTIRFWIIAFMFALLSLSTLKLR